LHDISHLLSGVLAVKHRSTLLKVAVVACALLLVAGYVSYRVGAFGHAGEPPTPKQALMPGSKSP
jgi:hypothetical protein